MADRHTLPRRTSVHLFVIAVPPGRDKGALPNLPQAVDGALGRHPIRVLDQLTAISARVPQTSNHRAEIVVALRSVSASPGTA